MSEKEDEARLLARLAGIQALAMRGLTVSPGQVSGVVIGYRGQNRGTWTVKDGVYFYTPESYSVPSYRADSLEEVVRITLSAI